MSGMAHAERILWRKISRDLLHMSLVEEVKIDWRLARKILQTQLSALSEDVCQAVFYQMGEAKILDARLGRRYDPGMALGEATKRALEAKRDDQIHSIRIREDVLDKEGNVVRPGLSVPVSTKLTPAQERALEFQKKGATMRVRRF